MGSHTAIWLRRHEFYNMGWNTLLTPESLSIKRATGRVFHMGQDPYYQGSRYGYTNRRGPGRFRRMRRRGFFRRRPYYEDDYQDYYYEDF